MKQIKLYGDLGQRFGSLYELDVTTPLEAFRALCANIKGFEKYLIESANNGIGFKIIADEVELTESELNRKFNKEFKVIPLVSGSNAEARTLIGAAIIYGATLMTPGGWATFAFQAGSYLAISGAAEILSRGSLNKVDYRNGEQRLSTYFNGAINTTTQGLPVPVGYGHMIVGGALISASLRIENENTGYTHVRVTKTLNRIARDTKDNYLKKKIPTTTYKKELVRTWTEVEYRYDWRTDSQKEYIINFWEWKFYYYEYQLVKA